jgi:hypothetical protein
MNSPNKGGAGCAGNMRRGDTVMEGLEKEARNGRKGLEGIDARCRRGSGGRGASEGRVVSRHHKSSEQLTVNMFGLKAAPYVSS